MRLRMRATLPIGMKGPGEGSGYTHAGLVTCTLDLLQAHPMLL